MSMRDAFACAVAALTLGIGTVTAADAPRLGQPISAADLAPWNISIKPDGSGLPPGSGTAVEGEKIYVRRCMVCHGENGAGAHLGPALADNGKKKQYKLIGNFWPYATTIFDYTRRAMPWRQPKTLTDNEVYALTAYMLASNKIIGVTDVMNAETLPKVRMPNRDGFIDVYLEKHRVAQ
jgi:S-disulfanyl-L-cysteine oxidoreductase SoxD